MDSTKRCSIDGCESVHKARGWCDIHYARYLKYGDPLKLTRQPQPKICSVDGCQRKPVAMGWCAMHYHRWARHGNPEFTLIASRGSGHIDSHGYHWLYIDGKLVKEHRKVMAGILGRPLLDEEHVHHINGKKGDNRPENLAIMSASEHHILHSGTEHSCMKGHPWTEESTARWNGSRRCRICKREYDKERQLKRRSLLHL